MADKIKTAKVINQEASSDPYSDTKSRKGKFFQEGHN